MYPLATDSFSITAPYRLTTVNRVAHSQVLTDSLTTSLTRSPDAVSAACGHGGVSWGTLQTGRVASLFPEVAQGAGVTGRRHVVVL